MKSKQTIFDKYWTAIADEMTLDFGCGHPETWDRATVEAFRTRMKEHLVVLFKADDDLAKRYNVPTKQQEYEYEKFGVPAYSSFWRLFIGKKEKSYRGNRTTRDLFALYFGADSFEDYIHQHGISGDEETASREVQVVKSEQKEEYQLVEKVSSQKEENNESKSSFIVLLSDLIGLVFTKVTEHRSSKVALILFSLLISIFIMVSHSKDGKNCLSEAITDQQFILVTTDDGLNFIDPIRDVNKLLVAGPHFTGFAYDQEDQLAFWSNTNHNYRSIGRANLSEGFEDKNRNHRFIKDLPYPLGITLDESKNILYLADCGNLDQLNDGSIRAYDYEGNFLRMIFQDCIDPSSIILDVRSQTLYWTDPFKDRIGRFNLKTNTHDPDFLVNVGSNPDGMAYDGSINRLYWASNLDSLIGWADLDSLPLQPKLYKLWEPATAFSINSKTGDLFYSTFDQEKIKWLQINKDSIQQSDCGQGGIQTNAGSPRVIQIYTQ